MPEPEVVFVIPGDLASPTGGYAYDRQVMALLPRHGFAIRHLALPGSFPHPTADDLKTTADALVGIPSTSTILFDGLAFSAIPADVLRAIKAPIIAIIHHPLSFEPGLNEQQRQYLHTSEKTALAFAKAVIVSSPTTKAVLSMEFGYPAERIVIAEPGTVRSQRSNGSVNVPSILSVGAVTPRKGYGVLIEALSRIAHLGWTATIAGTTERDPETANFLTSAVSAYRLSDRVTFTGEIEDTCLNALYEHADLFVSSSLYEGYGMVLAEAMAHGLAIVSTTGGAAAETIPDGAAIKVPPNDAEVLALAIARMLEDTTVRKGFADAAWQAGQNLPTWDQTTSIIVETIRSIG
jgi:glycosyltransferase involved in cell wall biosynthesis